MTHSFRLSVYLDFYRFHRSISESNDIFSSVHPKMKTGFMQTVNLLTIQLQLRVEGSNNHHFFKKNLLKKSEKSDLFFTAGFKIGG